MSVMSKVNKVKVDKEIQEDVKDDNSKNSLGEKVFLKLAGSGKLNQVIKSLVSSRFPSVNGDQLDLFMTILSGDMSRRDFENVVREALTTMNSSNVKFSRTLKKSSDFKNLVPDFLNPEETNALVTNALQLLFGSLNNYEQ